jgi:hypothetical protein
MQLKLKMWVLRYFSEFQVAEYQVTESHISEFNGIDIFSERDITKHSKFRTYFIVLTIVPD